MFAIVPVIVLIGSFSIGAFDSPEAIDATSKAVAENSEMTITLDQVASLETFPLN